MAKIPEKMRWIYDLLLTAAILAMATVLCTLLRRIDDGSGYVNLIFVLAVATISRWTEGYFWGIFSAVSGVRSSTMTASTGRGSSWFLENVSWPV